MGGRFAKPTPVYDYTTYANPTTQYRQSVYSGLLGVYIGGCVAMGAHTYTNNMKYHQKSPWQYRWRGMSSAFLWPWYIPRNWYKMRV